MDFALWWVATLAVLAVASLLAARSRSRVGADRVGLVFFSGVAAGLVMYLAPDGSASMRPLADLQLRFFCALGISWLVAIRSMRTTDGPASYSSLALAGFAGASAPLAAFVASSFMVCGGQPACAL